MGLKIDYWRAEVERLWALDDASRNNFLSTMLADVRPTSAAGESLGSLDELYRAPVLSKEGLRRLSEDLPDASKTFGRHTAGTTGDPTRIWLSKDELGRMLGVRDYCMSHYGVQLGDREGRIWGRPQNGWKPWLKDCLMNRRVFHPLGPDALETVKAILAYQPGYLYGYSSLILEAARLVEAHQLDVPTLAVVICTAETILPSQKAYIASQFRCPVAEEYGSTEFDIIAFECRNGHRHLVNPWLLVEPTEEGAVVSDVSRRTQSIVRYAQGDAVQVEDVACTILGASECLTAIEGRSINRFAFVSATEKFHAVEFARAMDSYFEDKNVQFRFCVEQRAFGRFHLMVPAQDQTDECKLKQHVERHIHEAAGCEITVEIGPLQSAGKTHYFSSKIEHTNDS
ncbi:CoF synthetase [Hydrocarboniclastica marina]|nr:CoF synthetase [Hydrocarboniclastica marina]